MREKLTISDIAKIAGVSIATVSNYLNGNYQKMSLKTKEKLREVIEQTDYHPNRLARSLVTQYNKTIGVVIADITNPFISTVMKGIHDVCQEEGYAVSFANSDNDCRTEAANVNLLLQQDVSGIIIDSVDPNQDYIKQLRPEQTVLVDRQAEELAVDTVVSDNKEATKIFVKEMLAKGYQDIYFVSYPIDKISTRLLRYQGFQEAFETKKDHLLVIETTNETYIKEKIVAIIEESPKKPAFLMMNGPTLLSFMKVIADLPYTYPNDFGLGSYEDLEWMQILKPSISTIRQDSYQIGCMAAKHLIHKLEAKNKQSPPRLMEIRSEIILRHSF